MSYCGDLPGQSEDIAMKALLEHENMLGNLPGVSGISVRQIDPEQDRWAIMVLIEVQGNIEIPRFVHVQNSPLQVPVYTEVIGKVELEEEHGDNGETSTRKIVVFPDNETRKDWLLHNKVDGVRLYRLNPWFAGKLTPAQVNDLISIPNVEVHDDIQLTVPTRYFSLLST
jgi:hypothetical protein